MIYLSVMKMCLHTHTHRGKIREVKNQTNWWCDREFVLIENQFKSE